LASVRECHLTLGSDVAAASAGAARVIARTDGVAIPAAHETTTSAAALTRTVSVPTASESGPARAWPTGSRLSATIRRCALH